MDPRSSPRGRGLPAGAAAAGIGLLAGAVVALLLLAGGGKKEPVPRPAPAPSRRSGAASPSAVGDAAARRAPTAGAPVDANLPPTVARRHHIASGAGTAGDPARRRLDEIRSWRDPFFGRYAEMKRALESFPREFPGAGDVEEARALAEELDRAFAEFAARVGPNLLRLAEEALAAGRAAEAQEKLKSLRERFGPSPWFEEEAGARAKELNDRIESLRAKAAAAAGVGLAGWWKFDDAEGLRAEDSSGNGRHGALEGLDGACWTEGRIGGGLRFKAKGYVAVPNEAAFDFTGPFSVTAWVKLDSWTKGYQVIVAKGDDAWRLQRDNRRNQLEFGIKGGKDGVTGSTNVADGRWHHVAGVCDGVMLRLYVDGAPDGARETVDHGTNDAPVLIGHNYHKRGRQFEGLMDDVRVYGRALSPAEVMALANPGGG